jgi:hypothetical protein
MSKMVDIKSFKAMVKEAIKNNNGDCSVCIQQIDNNVLAFANMRGIKASWQNGEDGKLTLYIPKEITFTLPYMEIARYCVHNGRRQIEIELSGRRLFSIRGIS